MIGIRIVLLLCNTMLMKLQKLVAFIDGKSLHIIPNSFGKNPIPIKIILPFKFDFFIEINSLKFFLKSLLIFSSFISLDVL